MNYYRKDSYNPRYRVQFKDDMGAMWTVDIEQPNYSGPVMPLVPASNPLVWDGQGDESQTDCILGSTGYLRLICLESQENLFNTGAVRPSEINNRRITVKRGTETMWLGFLTKEEYEQDLKSAPYEVELPIKSVVACLEDFTLPPYEDFEEPSDTFSLLQYVVGLTGADIFDIVTNVAEYEDYNGKKTDFGGGQYAHWTQGQVVITHWYDIDGGEFTPKTLKDVLETILYPYGHLREYGNTWGIFMATKTAGAIYEMSPDPEVSTGNRLSPTSLTIPSANLTSLLSCSTSNRSSIIDAPSQVKYERVAKSDNEIFSLDASMIKSSYNPTIGSCAKKDYNARKRYVSNIPLNSVNTYFLKNLFTSFDCGFCRIVDVVKKTGVNEFTYENVCPLALRLSYGSTMTFILKNKIISRGNYNLLKFSITERNITGTSPDATTSPKSEVAIIDNNNGKLLKKDGTWMDSTSMVNINWINTSELQKNGSEFYIMFNEERSNNSPHDLVVCFHNRNATGEIFLTPKLEYVENIAGNAQGEYSEQQVLRSLLKDTQYNKHIVSTDSTGEDVSIEYKTMCGQQYDAIDGAADIPFCGFKDMVGMIDIQPRKIIQLDAVRYSEASPLHLVKNYVLIQDSGTTFIPASVGCNAKECTMKLKLIQTNV